MTYPELEAAYIALAKEVEKRTLRIAGLCGAKRCEDAGNAALALGDIATNARVQYQMQAETAAPDCYDLAALSVAPDTLTNSETAYERD